ncbi:3'(2'),5'-bisphosphate nucleotidase CysQ [Nocardia alni]|uniref:3'(2'),5'-bisphosphate nucleotidase CysQ n=1 Tax=Nocardia alni TaxID=2815723 RepID=UPI001C2387D9|nr:3'(2'),5'-bisphosphate nucleotidase CysQ [Nocardia alni]
MAATGDSDQALRADRVSEVVARSVDGGDDHAVAARLAAEAGVLLLEIRGEGGAAGDRKSNELLLQRLSELRPDDAVLSEESADNPIRLERDRVWIIDPVDGTREYGEPPREDWAVHVALAIDGRAAIGAVALPAADLVLHTGAPPALAPASPGPIRIVMSRTRPPACVGVLLDELDAAPVPMGSAGAKAMAVVRGVADVYAHSGGQYEWDSCAPAAVAAAAGLHVSRLDGSPLRYNRPDPYLPDLLICRPELADTVLGILRGVIPR